MIEAIPDAPRILIIGLNYAPEPIGIGPYTAEMAEGLARRGCAVHVIAGYPYYPQWRPHAGYRGLWRRERRHGISVDRCRHYIPVRPNGWRRIVHYVTFAISTLAPGVRAAFAKPDVVLCVVPSLLSIVVAKLCAMASGAKLWVHLQDFEVDAAFATGLIDPRGKAGKIALAVENALLAQADRLSTISPKMMERAIAKGVDRACVTEIRNWAKQTTFQPSGEQSKLREEWGIGARKVALYSGNIAAKQGIEILIDVARLLVERSDIVFVICGEGLNRAALESLAVDLPNVQLHDLQPEERLGDVLTMADVHLLPQIAGAADLVLPSKLTNMLASGRPVVATAAPGTGLYDEIEGCGVAVLPGNAPAMAQAIVELADNEAERHALGRAAAARAKERWSREAIIDRLESELRALSQAAGARRRR